LTTKLKCLLLDDELPGLTYLKMLCQQIPELEVIKAFNNPALFLQELPSLDFDLCILDIEMPGTNGLQIANLLKGKPVIFTTAYKKYAADAFDLDAVDYLRKPIKMERLEQAVLKAVDRVEKKKQTINFIQVNTDKGKALLFFEQICYIRISETDSRDKRAYLQNHSELTLKNVSFEKLLSVLPSDQFGRVNKQEIVALKSIRFFTFDEVTIDTDDQGLKNKKLTLSEKFKGEFLEKIKNRSF
jgi:DNA-binding LytR/AlgR family response regulator